MTTTPWDKFFWSDFQTDSELKLCSLAAQGLWMRMLCVCAYAEPKGYLTVAGQALTVEDMQTLFGKPASEIKPLIDELEKWGVFSKNKAGIIYNRRMVRADKKAKTARENGRNGGNPSLSKERGNFPSDNQNSGNDTTKEPANGPGSNQKPEARSQKPEEGNSTTQTESVSAPAANEPPPCRGVNGDFDTPPFHADPVPETAGMSAADLCEIPERLKRKPGIRPIDVIKVFDDLRAKHFGEPLRRPFPSGKDSVIAQRWLDAGATISVIESVLDAAFAARAASKPNDPIGALNYFDKPMAAAIQVSKTALPDGDSPTAGTRQSAETNLWVGRVKEFRDSGFWPEMYGPTPDQPGCECPKDVLGKFPARKQGEGAEK